MELYSAGSWSSLRNGPLVRRLPGCLLFLLIAPFAAWGECDLGVTGRVASGGSGDSHEPFTCVTTVTVPKGREFIVLYEYESMRIFIPGKECSFFSCAGNISFKITGIPEPYAFAFSTDGITRPIGAPSEWNLSPSGICRHAWWNCNAYDDDSEIWAGI